MGFLAAVATALHIAGAAVLTYAWMGLGTLPNHAIVSKQKGGHLQFLTIQGLIAAWLTMAFGIIADVTSLGLAKRLKRMLFMIAMPLAALVSTVYWGLLVFMPHLILGPQSGFDPARSSSASDDLVRVPIKLDLALHAAPGTILLLDFFLFERKYSKKHAQYGGATIAIVAGLWYGWWVEYCAAHNNGIFPYPFLTFNDFPVRVAIYVAASTFAYCVFLFLNSIRRR